MLAPLALLSVLSSIALVAADEIMTTVNLTTQVLYQPAGNWFMTRNGHCGSLDRYTDTFGANATFYFSGASWALHLTDFTLTTRRRHEARRQHRETI